jgi:hypothetical protein
MSLILAASKAGILDRAVEIAADIAAQATRQIHSGEMQLRALMRHRGAKAYRSRMARQHWRVRR